MPSLAHITERAKQTNTETLSKLTRFVCLFDFEHFSTSIFILCVNAAVMFHSGSDRVVCQCGYCSFSKFVFLFTFILSDLCFEWTAPCTVCIHASCTVKLPTQYFRNRTFNCRKFSSNIEIDLANVLNSWIIQHNANGISLQNAIFKRTICNAVFSRARRFSLSQQIFSALSYTISMATGNQTLIIYNSCLSLLFLTKSLANIQLWFGLVYKIN